MARTDFPLSIGRRQLLASAEVTAIGIVPGVKTANSAAGLDYGQPSVMPGAEPGMFFRCNGPAARGNRPPKRNSPGGTTAASIDSRGIAPDEGSRDTGGI
jgi:hypothetical protein